MENANNSFLKIAMGEPESNMLVPKDGIPNNEIDKNISKRSNINGKAYMPNVSETSGNELSISS